MGSWGRERGKDGMPGKAPNQASHRHGQPELHPTKEPTGAGAENVSVFLPERQDSWVSPNSLQLLPGGIPPLTFRACTWQEQGAGQPSENSGRVAGAEVEVGWLSLETVTVDGTWKAPGKVYHRVSQETCKMTVEREGLVYQKQ